LTPFAGHPGSTPEADVTDREALPAAVLNSPGDDAARLVPADYLDETGEPDPGLFLRAGVEAARSRTAAVIEGAACSDALAVIPTAAGSGPPARRLVGIYSRPSVCRSGHRRGPPPR
jgi:uncharacterized protein (TIGR02996 family)